MGAGALGGMEIIFSPVLEAQLWTKIPLVRGSYLLVWAWWGWAGAGSGTGEVDSSDRAGCCGWMEFWGGLVARTAKTTFLCFSPESAFSPCSISHFAQQIVLLSHSGDPPSVAGTGVSINVMLSHRTNASSLCTLMRGLVPT